jgi:5'-methylthioadenosine phosphorylase
MGIEVGILGGSGLYAIDGLETLEEIHVETPFGNPSDAIRVGRLGGKKIAFLARHGRQHHLIPSEVPYRANIYAMRKLGVRWLIAAGAVGSLRSELAPGTFVLADQFIDRTKNREEHTFFGRGIVAHIGLAHPVCMTLHAVLVEAVKACEQPSSASGTYVNIEGPSFSTKAESIFHRAMGWDVVGMTNLAEAKLAREAEISYATIAMVTDYDCWTDEHVSVAGVVEQLSKNAANVARVLALAISQIPLGVVPEAQTALAAAIFTPRERWPEHRVTELASILAPYLAKS